MKFTNAAGTQEFYNSLERTKSTGIPKGSEGASLHEAKRYLNQFGYLKYEDSNNLENDEALEPGPAQQFWGPYAKILSGFFF